MMKKLIWRLKEQPTSESLRELVKDNLLTKEEARTILFNLLEENDRDKESLQSEIKFLRDLVEKLASKSQIITTIREVEIPYKNYPWYSPYITWVNCGSTGTFTAGTSLGVSSNSSFVDIKTF